jgi:hypothetical protein
MKLIKVLTQLLKLNFTYLLIFTLLNDDVTFSNESIQKH